MKHLSTQDQNIIETLEFPDNIREIAGMYIGDANDVSNILREAVDNAMDEFDFVPSFNQIIIEAKEDGGSFLIADKGRGMPINMHHKFTEKTAIRVATSHVNAGGKFSKTKASAGQNGVGIKATNALSDKFFMFVRMNDINSENTLPEAKSQYLALKKSNPSQEIYFTISYEKGIYIGESAMSSGAIELALDIKIPKGSSTVVYFEPDYSLIKNRNYKLPIYNFRYKGFTMKEYHKRDISILCNGNEMVTPLEHYKFKFKHRIENLYNPKVNKHYDLYFSFNLSNDLRSRSYKGSVNSIVVNSGLHIILVEMAIHKAISNITGCKITDKLSQGLSLRSILLAVKVDFKSQTKEFCNEIDGFKFDHHKELIPLIEKVLLPQKKFLQEYVNRINELDTKYKQLKDREYIKSKIQISGGGKKSKTPPKNLFDANRSNGGPLPELFLVEGRSAGGTMVDARDQNKHAIYALRGRPLNAVGLSIKAMVKNEEMAKLANVIDMGVNGHCDVKNRRFSKIVICADSDAYGGLIRSSLLANFGTHMTFLINLGMVYIAEAPVYEQDGKFYYQSDDFKGMDRNKSFKLFKGLGSMNSDQAKEVFFTEGKRRLIKVNPSGLNIARQFLQKNPWLRRELAKSSGNLGGVLKHADESEIEDIDLDIDVDYSQD